MADTNFYAVKVGLAMTITAQTAEQLQRLRAMSDGSVKVTDTSGYVGEDHLTIWMTVEAVDVPMTLEAVFAKLYEEWSDARTRIERLELKQVGRPWGKEDEGS